MLSEILKLRQGLQTLIVFAAPFVLSACTASLNELDKCGQLAEETCDALKVCDDEMSFSSCAHSATSQCRAQEEQIAADLEGVTIKKSRCFNDLEASCQPTLPESCKGLDIRLGCSLCDSEPPDEDTVNLCCSLNEFSAVCGGC